jgi:glutathione S-transferase
MIKLYQFEISPFCDKVRRVLHLKGQPYETIEIPMTQALFRLPRIHPTGKVPILEHDGRRIADSTEIVRYLEERFPDPPLIPRDPRERALCHVLEDWADESLYFYEMRMRLTFPGNARRWVPALLAHDPAPLRGIARPIVARTIRQQASRQGIGRKSEDQVVAEAARHVDAVDGWLGDRAWLVGEALTIADVAVFAQLVCIGQSDEGGDLLAGRPGVRAWMDRVDRATAAAAPAPRAAATAKG